MNVCFCFLFKTPALTRMETVLCGPRVAIVNQHQDICYQTVHTAAMFVEVRKYSHKKLIGKNCKYRKSCAVENFYIMSNVKISICHSNLHEPSGKSM